MTQHEYNTRQHDTTRVQRDTIRDNTSTMRYNTSKTRPNTSTKEARYQRRTYTPSFVLYQQPLRLLKTNLWPSSESHAKSVYNIKRYFKQFFTFLERTSTFIISLFRAIYRSSYPDVFTRKCVLLQLRSIVTEEYPCGTFACIFSCKLSKYSWNTFLEKHLWMTASVPTGIHLFRVKIEKLS